MNGRLGYIHSYFPLYPWGSGGKGGFVYNLFNRRVGA